MSDDLRLTVFLTVALMSGCARQIAGRVDESVMPAVETVEPTVVRYDVGPYYVREFRLKDGSRCVVSSNTGIACEWSPSHVQ